MESIAEAFRYGNGLQNQTSHFTPRIKPLYSHFGYVASLKQKVFTPVILLSFHLSQKPVNLFYNVYFVPVIA